MRWKTIHRSQKETRDKTRRSKETPVDEEKKAYFFPTWQLRQGVVEEKEEEEEYLAIGEDERPYIALRKKKEERNLESEDKKKEEEERNIENEDKNKEEGKKERNQESEDMKKEEGELERASGDRQSTGRGKGVQDLINITIQLRIQYSTFSPECKPQY